MNRPTNSDLYYSVGDFFKNRLGGKVYKVPVSLADDCPNRMGLKGMQTCIFCDEWGSAAYPEKGHLEAFEQMSEIIENHRTRYKAQKFLVYFQAYTNTFLKFSKLKSHVEKALEHPDVVGIVVGTRPDCLSKEVLNFWKETSQKTFVSVEMGVQSFNDQHLKFLRRGHTAQDSIDAISRIRDSAGIDVGIHLMFGLPGETREDVKASALVAGQLPINRVKLHNLHVLKNTPLEELFNRGEFNPIDLEEYTARVILFLQHLPRTLCVDRLSALSRHWDELVAPEWTRHKMMVAEHILTQMRKQGAFQGQYAKN